jgi:hypothetical protein
VICLFQVFYLILYTFHILPMHPTCLACLIQYLNGVRKNNFRVCSVICVCFETVEFFCSNEFIFAVNNSSRKECI